jgi:hypothetical protein
MDADDIMMPHRIHTQLQFLTTHPDAVLFGSNVQMFGTNEKKERVVFSQTQFPEILTWKEYIQTKSHWFMQHPTLCFRKSAILAVGNYNNKDKSICEDLELELKVLKRYGKIYNIPEPLVQYRIHPDQVTFHGKSSTPYWKEYRDKMIDDIIESF